MAEKKDSIRIKQFEWYEIETRVRQIMGELLQPFNKKQTEESLKINDIKKNILSISKKIEDHDFLLERENASKPTYIEAQDEKIAGLEEKISNHQIRSDTKVKQMEMVIQVYEQKVKQLNQLEKKLDEEIAQRAADFKKYKSHLDEESVLMHKKQESQQEQINSFRSSTRTLVSKLEHKMISFENKLKELEDQSKRRATEMRKIMDESTLHNEKLIKLDLQIIDVVRKIEEREKDSKLSEKFFGKVKEVENELKFLSNFLESYQPLYIQMMVSDTLNSFVEGKYRRKLCLFEQKKFAKLHHHILLNERNSLEQLMSSYTNNIRKIINRNKKYVINLTVQESVKYGANIYEFRVEDIKDDEDDNKKAVSVIIPQKEIEDLIEGKWKNIEELLKSSISQEIAPTRAWMKELQQQSLIRQINIQTRIQTVTKQSAHIEVDTKLKHQEMQKQLDWLSEAQRKSKRNQLAVEDYIRDILNFSSVINHIVIQDEIDRQGTALYALKSQKSQGESVVQPTIQLDPNCMNCQTKTSSMITQAFKMACLAYNPSQIRIDEQLFSREQILEISTNILEKLKKKMEKIQLELGKKAETSERHKHKQSQSAIKEYIGERQVKSLNSTARGKQLHTLLPLMTSAKDTKDKARKPQLSVFY